MSIAREQPAAARFADPRHGHESCAFRAWTSILYYLVTRTHLGWPRWKSVSVLMLFLSLDVPFFAATCLTFFQGGYVPVVLGLVISLLMGIYCGGRSLLDEYLSARGVKLETFKELPS